MVKLPVKVKKTIDDYLQALDQGNIPIKEAILFGSYARGTNKEWSDIDIALVSEVFVGNRMEDKDKIRKITLSVSSEIEVIPFSPEDFDLQNPLAKEILETGIRLI
jgi:predicted nucleotidyltransferase